MKVRCDTCHNTGDYPMKKGSRVANKAGFRDRPVCPTCRREAAAQSGNTVSPANV